MVGNNNNFSEKEIEGNLKSQRSLALYRIRLLEEEECDGDDCYHIDGAASRAIGFPSLFLPLLSQSIEKFIAIISRNRICCDDCDGNEQNTTTTTSLSQVTETIDLVRLLTIYRRISELDPVLDEEIGKQGAHLRLSRIIKLDIYSIDCCQCTDDDKTNEANQDTIIEIQDLACEIASFSKTFPLPASPFVNEDLRARLPLVFNICPVAGYKTQSESESSSGYNKDGITILINQVTDRQSAQKDVGFVMWPSAVVLSRWLVSNPKELHGKTVLELGAGCGLTGLVAAKIIQDFKHREVNELSLSETEAPTAPTAAATTAVPTTTTSSAATATAPSNFGSVILSDFNKTVVKNLKGNIGLNDLNEIATAEGLDFYQQDPNGKGRLTTDGVQRTDDLDLADVILAADVICQPEDAFAAARSIASALREGCKAIVVSADSKHRFGVEKLEEACKTVGSLSILSKSNVDDYLYNNNNNNNNNRDSDADSISRDDDMEKTSGFVHGMTLTMYTIQKNSSKT